MAINFEYDFSGYATRNDLKCSDGRTIRRDAFKANDGMTVPLVWQHQHNGPSNVLGHAVLENRKEGVYTYGSFNGTELGQIAKSLVQHGDITNLSIYANQLKHHGSDVIHGNIREVSLVLAGANPGASIDYVAVSHSDESEPDEAVFYLNDDDRISLQHSSDEKDPEENKKEDEGKEEMENQKTPDEKTVKDVFDTLNEEQKKVVYALVGMAMEDAKKSESDNDDEVEHGGIEMKKNVFDNEDDVMMGAELSHADMEMIISDAKRYGSLKDSFLAHAEEYGIENIDYLFPEAQTLTNTPEFISREMDWVKTVMSGVHHTPFSRIKSVFADITEDEARAKGYIKGKLKKEEVFSLLKRTTTPTTIYKKQKLDRDDILDINGFDVIAWLKSEMRLMLDEEIARAILIGDGRLNSDDDKISELNIRPIASDASLYTIQYTISAGTSEDDLAKNFIKGSIKSRKGYKGSGNPTLFTTEDMLTNMLLLEDGIGHKLYKTEQEIATALRVKNIVTVPVMEGHKDADGHDVYGVIVNLADYNVGADKGGAVSMFDDFDIDYNQMKYLIETRCSGALTKPYSAIVIKAGEVGDVSD